MGKRKKSTRKPQGPKRNDPLPTVFTCLFCNHERSVIVKLDKKAGVGYLDCKICGQKFQCPVNYLDAAVDVYSAWVDAADAVAQEAEASAKAASYSQSRSAGGRPAASSRRAADLDEDDEDDDRGYGAGSGVEVDDDEYD